MNASTWSVEPGEGPDGIAAIKSLGANEGDALCQTFEVTPGKTYYVSLQIKGTATGSTTTTAGGNNYVDFFVNPDGSLIKGTGTAAVDTVFTFAGTYYFGDEWSTLAYAVTIPEEMTDGSFVAIHIEKLVTGAMITDVKAYEVEAVYDDRVARKRFAFVEKLLSDSNFNVEEAASERDEVRGNISILTGYIEDGTMDDITTAENYMEAFEESVEAYLSVTSENIAKEEYFQYVTDIREVPSSNRGQNASGAKVGGFIMRGENWYHQNGMGPDGKTRNVKNNPYWVKYIGSTNQGPGSIALWNDLMPAGKYYIAAEMMNENNSGDVYGLEREVKAFVGTDSVSCGTIKGEDFTRFYFIGELKQGEKFEAGFYWDGPYAATTFRIGYFEVRKFGESVSDYITRLTAWNSFKTQWDAMVSARNKLHSMIGNSDYPWDQSLLTDAKAAWDGKYDAEVDKGWVDADGNDTGVATLEELQDWVKQQGQDPNAQGYQDYPIVRGYQYPTNNVIASNQVLTDMANAIKTAESVRDDAMNVTGDKTTLQTAIDAATTLLSNIKTTTTDATRVADSTTVAQGQQTLEAAVKAFQATVEVPSIVDIDFSNPFEELLDADGAPSGSYVIKGEKGQMEFVKVNLEGAEAANSYSLGYNGALTDVLRIGGSEATVNFAEADVPTQYDVIRVTFDIWYGNLSGKSTGIELRNSKNVRVAGFKLNRYNGVVSYNDFNNDANEGMDIKAKVSGIGSSSAQNEAICVDKNKSSFDLVIDLKAQTLQGTVVNGTNGTCKGAVMPFTAVEDKIPTKFVIVSDYGTYARNCWFDNLVIKKYPSSAEGVDPVGIKTVNTVNADNAVYSLSGVRVKSAVKPGLYIKNGKKVVIK